MGAPRGGSPGSLRLGVPFLTVNSNNRRVRTYTRGAMPCLPVPGERPTPRRGRPPSGGREAILAATLELLRERGAARLTTREVAERACVSEGSVFYHFTDRAGLVTAAIENCLLLLDDPVAKGVSGCGSVVDTLDAFTRAIEAFLEQALTVVVAAQSDAELKAELAGFMAAQDIGPHRGVEALAEFLRREQQAHRVRDDVDPAVIAMLVLSSCFLRVSQRQMIGGSGVARLPSREDVVNAVDSLLKS
jgi:AcrR family transcriptional regulator